VLSFVASGALCESVTQILQGLVTAVARPMAVHSVRSFTTMTIAERVALHHGKPDQTMQKMIDEVNLARAHARSMHVFYVIESKQTGSTQVACI
jgi:hypothetical protein